MLLLSCEPSKNVEITLKVTSSQEFSPSDELFLMSSLNYWDPGPEQYGDSNEEMSRKLNKDGNEWTITLTIPRGDTIKYLYTRGSNLSIEETAEHIKRENRVVIANEGKTINDTVVAWHDLPFDREESSWPLIELSKGDSSKYVYIGELNKETPSQISSLLYTVKMRETFSKGYRIIEKLEGTDFPYEDSLLFPFVISNAPDNSILVGAFKITKNQHWEIYLDTNNDNYFSKEEFLFTALKKNSSTEAVGEMRKVYYSNYLNNKLGIDSILFRVISFNKPLLDSYPSSLRDDAPVLLFKVHPRYAQGTLYVKGKSYLFGICSYQVGDGYSYKTYPFILIDRNQNGVFEKGPLTHEFLMHSKFFEIEGEAFEIADVDTYGRWVRLRPYTVTNLDDAYVDKGSISDKITEMWEATLITGEKIKLEELLGQYTLLDFWATWCKPCLNEIKYIKNILSRTSRNELQVVGVAINDKKEKLNSAIEKYEIDWPQILDEKDGLNKTYNVGGIPDPILLNPEGEIIERGPALRGKHLEVVLKKYIEIKNTQE